MNMKDMEWSNPFHIFLKRFHRLAIAFSAGIRYDEYNSFN